MSRAVHVVQDDVETADPWLLNPSEDTKQVVKALATAYEQSEYAIATRTKITEILSKSVSVPINLNSTSCFPSRYLP